MYVYTFIYNIYEIYKLYTVETEMSKITTVEIWQRKLSQIDLKIKNKLKSLLKCSEVDS